MAFLCGITAAGTRKRPVYLDYFDDDCDWGGGYYYTIDINNFFTNGLIAIFGNPAATNSMGKK